MRRAAAAAALALMGLGLAGGTACVVLLMTGAESLALMLDGTLILVDLAALTLLSLLIWPVGRR